MKKTRNDLLLIVILFYVLNLINTYFVTTNVLNRYLIAFKRTPWIELNSILGNFSALSILLFLGFILIRSLKGRIIYLGTVTFLLNIAIFSIGIFTKYYQTMFSIYEMTLFYNPAQALAGSIVVEAFRELIVYYRVIVFIPTFVFIYLIIRTFIRYKNEKEVLSEVMNLPKNRMLGVMLLLTSVILSLSTLGVVKVNMDDNWPITAERPLYGVQSAGLYNYYLGQLFGFDFGKIEYVKSDLQIYEMYNKNQAEYVNLFNQTYGNVLELIDAKTVSVDPALMGLNQSLNGIFEGKNIMVIHLETFNHFLLNEEGPFLDQTYFKTLKALLQESYVLNNFYTNVGLGNSSDAEFSVMTGLYPRGDTTVYWNYEKTPYELQALPKLFTNYYKASLHSDVKVFYNRENVHEKMYEFDDYFYFDEKEAFVEKTKNGYYRFADLNYKTDPKSPWISDLALFDWTKQLAITSQVKKEKFFLYPITMQPHTPYLYDPYLETPRFTTDELVVESATYKYINYERYYDSIFDKFIEMTKSLKDTVYVFYGDHGSGIPKSDLETILGRELSMLEYKTEMLKTLSFIYAPDDNDTSTIKRGLIKGEQNLVRSQVDLYRTIIELFNLETDHYYYGVNALSDERTFSIDTRTFDIITDDYYLLSKHLASDKETSLENVLFYIDENDVLLDPYEVFKYVIVYKKRMDEAITFNLHQYLKNN